MQALCDLAVPASALLLPAAAPGDCCTAQVTPLCHVRLPPVPPAALLCLHNAKEGGLSSWTSSISVHNEIVRRRPDLAEVRPGAHLPLLGKGLPVAHALHWAFGMQQGPCSALKKKVAVVRWFRPNYLQLEQLQGSCSCWAAQVLAGPWFFDRKGEVPEGKKPFFEIPVFNYYKARMGPFAG